MVAPTAGAVVLVPFPFSDLSQTKVRPALCVADASRDDWVLCQVTSSPFGDPHAIRIDDTDLAVGGLLVTSYVRPGKLFTAHVGLLVRAVGVLKPASFTQLVDAVVAILRAPTGP